MSNLRRPTRSATSSRAGASAQRSAPGGTRAERRGGEASGAGVGDARTAAAAAAGEVQRVRGAVARRVREMLAPLLCGGLLRCANRHLKRAGTPGVEEVARAAASCSSPGSCGDTAGEARGAIAARAGGRAALALAAAARSAASPTARSARAGRGGTHWRESGVVESRAQARVVECARKMLHRQNRRLPRAQENVQAKAELRAVLRRIAAAEAGGNVELVVGVGAYEGVERERKLRRSLMAITHGTSLRCFGAWWRLVELRRAVKAKVAKLLGGMLRHLRRVGALGGGGGEGPRVLTRAGVIAELDEAAESGLRRRSSADAEQLRGARLRRLGRRLQVAPQAVATTSRCAFAPARSCRRLRRVRVRRGSAMEARSSGLWAWGAAEGVELVAGAVATKRGAALEGGARDRARVHAPRVARHPGGGAASRSTGGTSGSARSPLASTTKVGWRSPTSAAGSRLSTAAATVGGARRHRPRA